MIINHFFRSNWGSSVQMSAIVDDSWDIRSMTIWSCLASGHKTNLPEKKPSARRILLVCEGGSSHPSIRVPTEITKSTIKFDSSFNSECSLCTTAILHNHRVSWHQNKPSNISCECFMCSDSCVTDRGSLSPCEKLYSHLSKLANQIGPPIFGRYYPFIRLSEYDFPFS